MKIFEGPETQKRVILGPKMLHFGPKSTPFGPARGGNRKKIFKEFLNNLSSLGPEAEIIFPT